MVSIFSSHNSACRQFTRFKMEYVILNSSETKPFECSFMIIRTLAILLNLQLLSRAIMHPFLRALVTNPGRSHALLSLAYSYQGHQPDDPYHFSGGLQQCSFILCCISSSLCYLLETKMLLLSIDFILHTDIIA